MSSGPESNKDDDDTVIKKEEEGDLRRREEKEGDGEDETTTTAAATTTTTASHHGESNYNIKSEPTETTVATKQEEHDDSGDSGGNGDHVMNVEAEDNVVVKTEEKIDEELSTHKDPSSTDTTTNTPAASAPAIAVSQSPTKPDSAPAAAPAPATASASASPAVTAAAPHPLAATAAVYPPYHLHHHHPQNPHYPYAHYYAYPPPPPGWPVQQQQQQLQQPPSTATATATTATAAGTKSEEGSAGPSGSANDELTPATSHNAFAESSTAAAVPGQVAGAGTSDAANPGGEQPAPAPAPSVDIPAATAAAAAAATPHPYYHYYYPPPHQHHYPGFGPPPPQHPGQAPPPPPPHHPHFPPGYPPHLAGLPLPTAPATHGEGTDGGQPGGATTGAMDSIVKAAASSHAASTAAAAAAGGGGGGDGTGKGPGPGPGTPGMYSYYNVKKDENIDKSEQRPMDLESRIGATSPSQIDSFHREEVTTMGCNCKKTKCLKLYCQCFAVKIYCGTNCRCMACRNTPQNENERQDAIRAILSRNPMAFDTKFQKHATATPDPVVQAQVGPYGQVVEVAHKLGCKCRKSACMKKYCECYAGNVKCSINCRCQGCKNMPPEGLPSLDERLRLSAAQHSRSAAPSVDAVMATFKGHASAVSAAATAAGGGSTQPGRSRSNSHNTVSSPNRAPPAVSHVKANSISDAAQNLAFLKHGGSPQPKKPPSSRSEPEKTAVNALLMAAMVMTEQAEMSTPPTTDQVATNAKGSISTPDSATTSPGEKYKTPQRNLMKKFGSPKRKTPDGGNTKSQRSTKIRKDQKSSPSKEISNSKAKRTKRKETKSTGTANDANTSMEEEFDNLPVQGLTPVTARTIEFRGLMVEDSPTGSKPSKKKGSGTK